MKNRASLFLLLTASLTTFSTLFQVPQAQAENIELTCSNSFNAEVSKKIPTTIAFSQNKKIAIIQWVKKMGSWTPEERCKVVSEKLQKAQQDGTLKFLTNGKQSGNNVICAAKEVNGPCLTMIMTLRPNDKPLLFLNELKDVLNGRAVAGTIIHSSGEKQLYVEVNLEEVLKNSR